MSGYLKYVHLPLHVPCILPPLLKVLLLTHSCSSNTLSSHEPSLLFSFTTLLLAHDTNKTEIKCKHWSFKISTVVSAGNFRQAGTKITACVHKQVVWVLRGHVWGRSCEMMNWCKSSSEQRRAGWRKTWPSSSASTQCLEKNLPT